MRSWGERGLKPVHLCLANIGLTILFSMAYRLSLKWSEGGPGGVPPSSFRRDAALPGPEMRRNVPNPTLPIYMQT
jgi:hypothetical protein